MKGLSILGSTGSIGTNVLRVVDAFPGRFESWASPPAATSRSWRSRWPGTGRSRVGGGRGRPRAALAPRDLSTLRAVTGREAWSRWRRGRRSGWSWPPPLAPSASCPPTARSRPARTSPSQQGDAGDGRRADAGRARETGARLLPSTASTARSTSASTAAAARRATAHPHASGAPSATGSRESFGRITRRRRSPTRRGGWDEDHDRLRHPHEQGPGGDRGRWLFGVEASKIDVLIHPVGRPLDVELVDGTVLAQLG